MDFLATFVLLLVRVANQGQVISSSKFLYNSPKARPSFRRQTAQGSTALMLACKRGHEEVVRVLLTAGAELHQKDSRGRTARDTASKRHHETILAMLHPAKQMRLMQVRLETSPHQRENFAPTGMPCGRKDRIVPVGNGRRTSPGQFAQARKVGIN